MCEHCSNIVTNVRQYDPTRTTTIRNRFARDMRSRFNEIARVVKVAIVDKNALGLGLVTHQVTTPGNLAFNFPLDANKLEAFMEWLALQVERGILEVSDIQRFGSLSSEYWTNAYITDTYKKGVIRARYELRKAGFDVPTIEQQGGINAVLSSPVHVNKLALLYARVFRELRGITEAMDTQISRILAQGLADGDGPKLLARKLVSVINGTGTDQLGLDISYINPRSGKQVNYFMPGRRRAEILARTETIRAHHVANMQEYESWGAIGLKVKAEFQTAGDDRVCPECSALEGNIYTIEQAWSMIPVHPLCRCIMLPITKI